MEENKSLYSCAVNIRTRELYSVSKGHNFLSVILCIKWKTSSSHQDFPLVQENYESLRGDIIFRQKASINIYTVTYTFCGLKTVKKQG